MKTVFLKRLFTVFFAIALFFACGEFLNYILTDDTKSYTRIMFHQLYNSPQNIDIAFVGSSHVYRSLDPRITDKEFGKYTFNAGTSSQGLDGSYAVIQELCNYHNPEHIFLELYYAIADEPENNDRNQMTATYILSDYMRPSIRKLEYIINASSSSHYVNSFIPARRNWKKLFDFRYISDLVGKKQENNYKKYQWTNNRNTEEYYVEKGFVADNKVANPLKYWNKLAYGRINKAIHLTEKNDWYKSLIKIIKYCKEKNIKLTLFIVPEPEWTLVGKGNYQDYYNFIQNIAKNHKIDFYDFNLCKTSYFDANEHQLFKDEQHLNIAGAEKFSKLFSDFFMNRISKEQLFHSSFNEKVQTEPPKVYGLAGPHFEKNSVGKGYVIANRANGIDYKIMLTPKNKKSIVLQDFSEKKDFYLPQNEHGTLNVYWRLKDNPSEIKMITEKY